VSTSEQIMEYFKDAGVVYQHFPPEDEQFGFFDQQIENMARTILLRIDNRYAILVSSVLEQVNYSRMRQVLGAGSVVPATEEECRKLFPECDSTALPVLDCLYEMRVYCSKKILSQSSISFNPGTHDEVLSISIDDFVKLGRPVIGEFTDYPGDFQEIW